MKTTATQKAIEYCKTLSGSEAYKEAMLYAKFGGRIGIQKCNQIATKF